MHTAAKGSRRWCPLSYIESNDTNMLPLLCFPHVLFSTGGDYQACGDQNSREGVDEKMGLQGRT